MGRLGRFDQREITKIGGFDRDVIGVVDVDDDVKAGAVAIDLGEGIAHHGVVARVDAFSGDGRRHVELNVRRTGVVPGCGGANPRERGEPDRVVELRSQLIGDRRPERLGCRQGFSRTNNE